MSEKPNSIFHKETQEDMGDDFKNLAAESLNNLHKLENLSPEAFKLLVDEIEIETNKKMAEIMAIPLNVNIVGAKFIFHDIGKKVNLKNFSVDQKKELRKFYAKANANIVACVKKTVESRKEAAVNIKKEKAEAIIKKITPIEDELVESKKVTEAEPFQSEEPITESIQKNNSTTAGEAAELVVEKKVKNPSIFQEKIAKKKMEAQFTNEININNITNKENQTSSPFGIFPEQPATDIKHNDFSKKIEATEKKGEREEFEFKGASEGFKGKETLEKQGDVEILPKKESKDIKKIKIELEKARNDYASMDHKKQKMWDSVLSFFGRSKKKEKNENLLKQASMEKDPQKKAELQNKYLQNRTQDDADVIYMEAQYLNKLRDYKDAKFAEIKESGLTGKDSEDKLQNIAKEITIIERANLFDTQTEIKIQNKKESWAGKMQSYWLGGVNAYKSMPMKKKLLFSAALIAGGAVSAGIGAPLAAAAFMGGRTFIRLLGSSGFMYGIATKNKADLEKINEKELIESGEEESKEMLEKTKNLSNKEKLERFQNLLNESLFNADAKLQEMKTKSARMTLRSISVGVAAGLLVYNIKNLLDATGISDKIHNFFGRNFTQHAVEHISQEQIIPIDQNVEHTLIDYIKENHPDIKDPEAAAHRMVLDFMHEKGIEEPNLVYSSTSLVIDEHDGLKLKDIKGNWGHLDKTPGLFESEKISTSIEVPIEKSEELIIDNPIVLENPKIEAPGVIVPEDISIIDEDPIEVLSPEEQELQKGINNLNIKYTNEIDTSRYAQSEGESFAHLENAGEIDRERIFLKEDFARIPVFVDKLKTEIFKMRSGLADSNSANWKEIKDLTYQQAYSEDNIRPRLKNLVSLYEKEFGIDVSMPGDYETIEHWTSRIARRGLEFKFKIAHE